MQEWFQNYFCASDKEAMFREILTQRLEDFSSSKFPVKEDSVVLCVEGSTHPDQNHLHGA